MTSEPGPLRLGPSGPAAKALCVFVHGRGQTPEDMEAHVVARHSPSRFAHRNGASPFSPARVKNIVTRLGKVSNVRMEAPDAAAVTLGPIGGQEQAVRRGRGRRAARPLSRSANNDLREAS